jgi:hypothetical protein
LLLHKEIIAGLLSLIHPLLELGLCLGTPVTNLLNDLLNLILKGDLSFYLLLLIGSN